MLGKRRRGGDGTGRTRGWQRSGLRVVVESCGAGVGEEVGLPRRRGRCARHGIGCAIR